MTNPLDEAYKAVSDMPRQDNKPDGSTPKPWNVEGPQDEPYGDIHIKGDGRTIANLWQDDAPVHEYNAMQKANAALIVKAVNTYDERERLLAEAEAVIKACVELGKDYGDWLEMTNAEAFLAKIAATN